MENFEKIVINNYVNQTYVVAPHMIAAKIVNNKDKNLLISIGGEGWDFVYNGVEKLVKEVCDYANIPYENITFMSGNQTPKLKYFKHKLFPYNLNIANMEYADVETPSNFGYGLFLARPSNERLYAFYNHLAWHHNQNSLSTFHFDIRDEYEGKSEYTDFVIQHTDKWNFVKNRLPHSDFGNKLTYPIVDESHSQVEFWQKVYSKISIELVCETSVHNESFFITEKTLRPILYKRPFVIIGSKNYEKKLKEIGIDTFDDLINKEYDQFEYYTRIDKVFESLEDFLSKINTTVFNSIEHRLEKNKSVVEQLVKKEFKQLQENRHYYKKYYPEEEHE